MNANKYTHEYINMYKRAHNTIGAVSPETGGETTRRSRGRTSTSAPTVSRRTLRVGKFSFSEHYTGVISFARSFAEKMKRERKVLVLIFCRIRLCSLLLIDKDE